MELFHCASLVIDQWNEDTKVHAPMAYAILATALSCLGLRLATPGGCFSFGVFLVYGSVRAEVAGNWVYMTEAVMKLVYYHVSSKIAPPVSRLFPWIWSRRKVKRASLFVESACRRVPNENRIGSGASRTPSE
jgi:hypothetical protein